MHNKRLRGTVGPRRPRQPQVALQEPVRGLGWVPLRRHRRESGQFPASSNAAVAIHHHHRQRSRRHLRYHRHRQLHTSSKSPKDATQDAPKAKAGEPTSPKASLVPKASPAVDLVTPRALKQKQRRLWASCPIGHQSWAQEDHWKLDNCPSSGTVCL